MVDELIGNIVLTATNYVPNGYLQCNGQLLSIQDYQALYSLLGNRFGGVAGSTFAVPFLVAEPGLMFIICVNGQYPGRS